MRTLTEQLIHTKVASARCVKVFIDGVNCLLYEVNFSARLDAQGLVKTH